jgi:hypothetical protein
MVIGAATEVLRDPGHRPGVGFNLADDVRPALTGCECTTCAVGGAGDGNRTRVTSLEGASGPIILA